jgi:MFS family permease
MRPVLAPKRQPRLFYGWYIVGASFVTNLAMTAAFWQGFQILFLPILREFGWSRTAISGAFTLRQVETGILAPLLGFMVDRVGPRRIIIVSGVVVGVGLMAVSQTSSLWTFYLFFMVASLGASGTSHSITWPVAISHWFVRRRGLALGLGTSGPFLAGVLLPFATLMTQEIGWRWTVFFMGLGVWLVVVPAGMLVRNSPQPYGLAPDGDPTDDPESHGRQASAGRTPTDDRDNFTLREALGGRTFWLLSVVFAALFFGLSGFQVHQIPYFEDLGLSATQASFTVTVVLLLSGVGRMGAGALTDVFDIRWVLAAVVLLHMASWLYLLTMDVSSVTRMLPFTIVYGVAFGAMVSLRPVILSKLFGNRALGSLSGLLQAASLISGMVGPVMMGRVFDTTGEYTVAFQITLVVTAAALPLVLFIRPGAAVRSPRNALRR